MQIPTKTRLRIDFSITSYKNYKLQIKGEGGFNFYIKVYTDVRLEWVYTYINGNQYTSTPIGLILFQEYVSEGISHPVFYGDIY